MNEDSGAMAGARTLNTPKGVVKVRLADRDDARKLRELRLEALANHPEAYAADPDATAAEPIDVLGERLATASNERREATFVAAADGELVGMTGVFRGRWPKTKHAGTIWGVYVRPGWRGLGIGSSLVKECVAWARTQEMVIVRLAVVVSNVAAIRCYSSCGFSVYGIEPRSIYYDGVFHDEILMARET